jgi:hypothetical protein
VAAPVLEDIEPGCAELVGLLAQGVALLVYADCFVFAALPDE